MSKLYAIINSIITVGVIFWNYATNVIGINDNTVGSLSAEYDNLFTPASYAFAIWGLIFISLLSFCVYQLYCVFSEEMEDDFVLRIGAWYSIANLANAAWLWFWLNEITWLTIPIMLVMLLSLIQIINRLNMNRVDATTSIKTFVWIPIGLYAGWIAVATVANVSAYLAKINFDFLFSETIWTIIMLVIALMINLIVLKQRKLYVFAGVGVWAFTAISVRHWETIPSLQWIALIAAAITLGVFILINLFNRTAN